MKALLFCGKVDNKNANIETNLGKVGLNSGNMLFWHSLSNILDVDGHTLQECAWKKVDLNPYNSFVTTDLIWIQENATFPGVRKQLELAGDRPLVPISIGLQSGTAKKDFRMHEDTVRLLAELQERCALGIRGQYTAEILNMHGIKNIKVIGCPSMYFPFDYRFKIRKKETDLRQVSVNMRSMYSPLQQKEQKFMVYAANHKYSFCEQTSHPFCPAICKDGPTFEYLNKWLNTHKTIFFDVDDWRGYMSDMDFSMGCRFHGNVIALWSGVPALFITVDSRTTEMCNHFKLPTISMNDFDAEKDIHYYYDLADYTQFNKNYALRLDEFIDFLKGNDLPIKKRIDEYYDRKICRMENDILKLMEKA